MSDIRSLQARLARVKEAHGPNSEAAKAARIKLQSAIHADLARKPIYRVQATTERSV
jgi:hypothetical protein